jgi:hypothetical protein
VRLFDHAMFGAWALGLAFLIGSIWEPVLGKLVTLLWSLPAGAYAGTAARRLGW